MGAQLLCVGLAFTLWWATGHLVQRAPDRLRIFVRALRGGLAGVVCALLLAALVTHLGPSRVGTRFFPALATGLSIIGVTIGTLATLAIWKRHEEPAEKAEAFAKQLREASGGSESGD